MRIRDKLTHNGDHFPTDAFKIAYVVARLGGEASQHVSARRRHSSYSSVNNLLDHLSNVYEMPLSITKDVHREAYRTIKRQCNQPFLEFYGQFLKYSEYELRRLVDGDEYMMFELISKSGFSKKDRDRAYGGNWTWPRLKAYLIQLDLYNQEEAQELADKKSKVFAKQYIKARLEDAMKPRGKYAIIPRPDPEEYRR